MTQEMKATPGPWFRDGRTIYALDPTGRSNRFSAHVHSGYTYLPYDPQAEGERTTAAELDAVAALLHAAPEMYEALKAAHHYLDAFGCDKDMASTMDKIEAALLKATVQP